MKLALIPDQNFRGQLGIAQRGGMLMSTASHRAKGGPITMHMPRLPLVFLSMLASLLSACGGGGNAGSGTGPGNTPPPNASNEWTWMRGADADDSVPPGWSNPWTEPYNSNPYYGTLGVTGPHNVPGGRNSSAYWADRDGNFWLFGGDGIPGSPGYEILLNDLWEFSPATNEWTWMGGSDTVPSFYPNCAIEPAPFCAQPGIYGTQGTPSLSNIPGGRELATTWTDSAGNFWLFGGMGGDSARGEGYLNDLWKFNPATREWVWISGSSTMGTYSHGQAGSYGTRGVAGPGNVPPGLTNAMGWIDKNDNLWLFGGTGVATGGVMGYDFNNLWEFNPATNEWTWISGDGGGANTDYGVYGTLGTPAAGNIPSGREGATSWTDPSGNFWLFGGSGVYPPTPSGGRGTLLNELWEFNPTTRQWTWVAGTAGGILNSYGNPVSPGGSYGTLGVASPSNVPGARMGSTGWVDNSGNLWLFGGFGDGTVAGDPGELNDLWKFSPATKQWTWMGGSTTTSPDGVYGVEGTPAAANTPGGRQDAASWRDGYGNFWLFAGSGHLYGYLGGATILNDLWRYQP